MFFDNVGGDILDLALTRLKPGARIARKLVSPKCSQALEDFVLNFLPPPVHSLWSHLVSILFHKSQYRTKPLTPSFPSAYNTMGNASGLKNYLNLISQRASITGSAPRLSPSSRRVSCQSLHTITQSGSSFLTILPALPLLRVSFQI